MTGVNKTYSSPLQQRPSAVYNTWWNMSLGGRRCRYTTKWQMLSENCPVKHFNLKMGLVNISQVIYHFLRDYFCQRFMMPSIWLILSDVFQTLGRLFTTDWLLFCGPVPTLPGPLQCAYTLLVMVLLVLLLYVPSGVILGTSTNGNILGHVPTDYQQWCYLYMY